MSARDTVVHVITTERLLLRRWTASDLEPFAALNADPEVMRYFPMALTASESDAMVERIEARFESEGLGFWAVEREGKFLGFTGLSRPKFDAHFTPVVEVGWRFARSAWGNGFATEAARAALTFGFETLGLDEIVAFTTVTNEPSRAVMRRIGMTHNPADDFDHPLLPGHPLQRHVLYRMRQPIS
ncbi:GNAT family N-acetyltransferase [Diaminobutyricimonas sp. TR449]|uniref:GNAT family N-acetyltransferase n=1 Tax=Diaminobutyricimonas sp. TR449 TaxID=2708076 RepID=UPI0014247A2C|nr:GNAT family N-acetyltransferase [Diaminobutyricimonas sp. TR449]